MHLENKIVQPNEPEIPKLQNFLKTKPNSRLKDEAKLRSTDRWIKH